MCIRDRRERERERERDRQTDKNNFGYGGSDIKSQSETYKGFRDHLSKCNFLLHYKWRHRTYWQILYKENQSKLRELIT